MYVCMHVVCCVYVYDVCIYVCVYVCMYAYMMHACSACVCVHVVCLCVHVVCVCARARARMVIIRVVKCMTQCIVGSWSLDLL